MKSSTFDRLTSMAEKENNTVTETKKPEPEKKESHTAGKTTAETTGRKDLEKKTVSEKKPNVPKKNEETEQTEFVGSRIFDIEADGVIYPERRKKGKEKKEYKFASICLPLEEYEYIEKNARKHRMSLSAYIRTLAINGD
jgi:hypothetical protein